MFFLMKLFYKTRHRKELQYLAELEELMTDVRKMRHQYNNLFQTLIFYIENEQWDSMAELKKEILLRTSEANEDCRLQLLKASDRRLRSFLLLALKQCEKFNITLKLGVTGEMKVEGLEDSFVYEVLSFSLDNIIEEVKLSSDKILKMKVFSDSQGIAVSLEGACSMLPEAGKICTKAYCRNTPDWELRIHKLHKQMGKNPNIIWNNSMEGSYLKQEIVYSYGKESFVLEN